MKFKVQIQGVNLCLTSEQVEAVFNAVYGAERLDESYVGSGSGDDGGSYVKLLRPMALDTLSFTPVHDDFIEAMRLKTKLYDEAKAK